MTVNKRRQRENARNAGSFADAAVRPGLGLLRAAVTEPCAGDSLSVPVPLLPLHRPMHVPAAGLRAARSSQHDDSVSDFRLFLL